MATMWKPSWWKDETHGSAWARVREALRRDWEQTKKDLHLGGHELNQGVKDTVAQMSGKKDVPATDAPNPPKVIGSFDEAELPMGYGFGARREYGGERFSLVEERLRGEWDRDRTGKSWDEVRPYVRRGWEQGDRSSMS